MSSIRIVSKLLLAALVLAGTAAAWAQQKLIPTQSDIVFVSKQLGVPVEGHFKRFDAQVKFDPAKPQTSKIAFTVDTGSASLGVPEVDNELPKPVWFNVKTFPKATFESSSVKAVGAGKFEVAGKLTIKGQSQPVVVPVTLTQSGGVTTATGAFTLKRLNYKIGEDEWADTSMVADDVQVKLKLALSGVGKL